MSGEHDTGYKMLFSHPEMVRDLLIGYVPGAWLRDVDFATLESVKASYVAENLKHRHDDLVWRVRLEDRWLWVYLILEFQSEPDAWMALRLLVYVGLLAQDIVRRNELADGRLPPILPLVLYNGLAEWRAVTEVEELFAPPPKGLERYRPRLNYHLIDEARLQLHPLESVRTTVDALFRLEHGRTPEDLRRMLRALDGMLKDEHLQPLRRSVNIWIKSLLRRKAPGRNAGDIERIEDLLEADTMLAERIDSWFEEATRKGMQQGMQRGEALALKRLLARRFGPLSEEIATRVDTADLEVIEAWFDRAIDAGSIGEVLDAPGSTLPDA